MSEYVNEVIMGELDPQKLNAALWAANDQRFTEGQIPSMEELSEAVIKAIEVYTGLKFNQEKWDEFYGD